MDGDVSLSDIPTVHLHIDDLDMATMAANQCVSLSLLVPVPAAALPFDMI